MLLEKMTLAIDANEQQTEEVLETNADINSDVDPGEVPMQFLNQLLLDLYDFRPKFRRSLIIRVWCNRSELRQVDTSIEEAIGHSSRLAASSTDTLIECYEKAAVAVSDYINAKA